MVPKSKAGKALVLRKLPPSKHTSDAQTRDPLNPRLVFLFWSGSQVARISYLRWINGVFGVCPASAYKMWFSNLYQLGEDLPNQRHIFLALEIITKTLIINMKKNKIKCENIWIGIVKKHTEKEELRGLTCCLILTWPRSWNWTWNII
jgi:hypothetical protein